MTFGMTNSENGILPDPVILLEKYLEVDSLNKVREWLATEDIINRNTGKPPTKQAINQSIWLYILEKANIEDIYYEYIKPTYQSRGIEVSLHAWKIKCVRTALYLLSRKKFQEFVKHSNLEDILHEVQQERNRKS